MITVEIITKLTKKIYGKSVSYDKRFENDCSPIFSLHLTWQFVWCLGVVKVIICSCLPTEQIVEETYEDILAFSFFLHRNPMFTKEYIKNHCLSVIHVS